MRVFLFMAFLLVVVMVGMKACSAGLSSIKGGVSSITGQSKKVGEGLPDTITPGTTPTGQDGAPLAKQGNGYQLHAEKFRGFMGFSQSLRTDLGQYTPGSLSHHGLVLRTNEREALIKGVSGLVVVVAVDDYTRPEPQATWRTDMDEDRKNWLAEPPAARPNASPAGAVPVKTVHMQLEPMPDVPREESVRLTQQQQRQAKRGVLVRGPFKAETIMGSGATSGNPVR